LCYQGFHLKTALFYEKAAGEEVQRIDTLGVSLFQTVQDKITYQVVRMVRAIDAPTKSAWKEAIDQAAGKYMDGLRFKNFEKQSMGRSPDSHCVGFMPTFNSKGSGIKSLPHHS